MKLTYAHQVRHEESCEKPFELRQAEVALKVFPPDDIDDIETYQVIHNGKSISEACNCPDNAFSEAAVRLMWMSRESFGH